MEGRLHLEAAHGDVGLLRLPVVVHVTPDESYVGDALAGQLPFAFGQPGLTANLADVMPAAQNGGAALLIQPPPGLIVGYGVFTSAYVDRVIRRVGGSPGRYLAGRSSLALYQSGDAETERRALEAETVAEAGFGLLKSVLPAAAVVGWLKPDAGANTSVQELTIAAQELAPVAIDSIAKYWTSLVQSPRIEPPALLSHMRRLVESSVESEVIGMVRRWRLEALAGMGYHFYEGQKPWSGVTAVSQLDQRQRLNDLQRRLASSQLLTGELDWLKQYVSQVIHIMEVELEMPGPGSHI